ncbi:hypothetical protein MRS44_011540 [Fusarium solani]|uniref:uncharacterized protein n=1 Tax=Fusarium solani TaxID=169388 RepID=UPI0032C47080|nr:hypothetical protein MRS44_011540 [Fusarium solani]
MTGRHLERKRPLECAAARSQYLGLATRAAGDPSIKDLEAVTGRIIDIDLGDEKTVIQAAAAYGTGPLDLLVNIAGRPSPAPPFQSSYNEADMP